MDQEVSGSSPEPGTILASASFEWRKPLKSKLHQVDPHPLPDGGRVAVVYGYGLGGFAGASEFR